MAKNIVIGIFTDRAHAESALSDFENHGYSPKEISVIVKDGIMKEQIAESTGANVASGLAEGATTGGVVGGVIGLLGALVGLGVPEETAKYYEQHVREGAIILAVSPKDTFTVEQVSQIFDSHGAQQVHYLA